MHGLVSTLLAALVALAALTSSKPDSQPSVVGSTRIDENKHNQDIAIKEVCYLEMYEAKDWSTLSYQKETLVKDEYARSVYLTDGYKKDENGAEYYYKSFCYKDFKYSEHKEKTFGDSNAASVVDGGIGRAFRNVNIVGNGGAGDSSSLETGKGDTEATKSGLGKNLY
ncbi:hypothetical protein Rt10032_c07g3122 [Rhodotorula toruloides]|uniref:Uncharacterized protein n=1 Tax=Rhodotorula toruloides TaxID=5286 RepID=A0A511KGR4_RHOTO|nr:hypothetical protein Rt10032_c07g3122 [Rhodotorula toruloides]